MNISSALIKQVISCKDSNVWSSLRRDYLPTSYHRVFSVIEKHVEKNHELPSFDDLVLEVRDSSTKEKVLAIEALAVDADPGFLLECLKNEYAQRLILNSLEKYIDNSVAYLDADESVSALHDIVLDVGDKVELDTHQQSMQRISVFEEEKELEKYVALGLNEEYDYNIKFSPKDLILVGGRRGAGKSLTCANIANHVYNQGKTAIYFTIEMDEVQTIQRICSVATGVPFSRLRTKNLDANEWERVVSWFAGRFQDGDSYYQQYLQHRSWDTFYSDITTEAELLPTQQVDIVYDPSLTLSKIRAELDNKVKRMNVGIVIVDYINQVKRSNAPARGGQYDWTEQIEVSKALKSMAQEYEVPVFSPYQTDATGEARFAKGLLDAADAAFALETWDHEDNCITFNCVKMRNNTMTSFSSVVDWESLQIGPETALTPKQREEAEHKTGEEIDDL